MLRVIAGKFKGKKLLVPDVSRPITDRIRTSMFDTLSPIISNAEILDLYAGSGAFGLEALSRGAQNATFVEDNQDAIDLLHQNIINVNATANTTVTKQKVSTFLATPGNKKYDVIMIDPPFPMPLEDKLKDVNLAKLLLKPDGVLVFRLPSKEKYNVNVPDLTHLFSKNMGVSCINYYRSMLQ